MSGKEIPERFRRVCELDGGLTVAYDVRDVLSEDAFNDMLELSRRIDGATGQERVDISLEFANRVMGEPQMDELRRQLEERDGYVNGYELNRLRNEFVEKVIPKN